MQITKHASVETWNNLFNFSRRVVGSREFVEWRR